MHQRVVVVFAVQQLPHQARILIAQSLGAGIHPAHRAGPPLLDFDLPADTGLHIEGELSMRILWCEAPWIDSRFAMPSLRSPATGGVKPTDVWLATTGDEIPKLSEIWNRSLFSESTYREDLTDRVRSAVRRRRSFATTFSSKIGLFGSEFHPCNYPWQFRHCDDTKNCAPICIRSPGHVSRDASELEEFSAQCFTWNVNPLPFPA